MVGMGMVGVIVKVALVVSYEVCQNSEFVRSRKNNPGRKTLFDIGLRDLGCETPSKIRDIFVDCALFGYTIRLSSSERRFYIYGSVVPEVSKLGFFAFKEYMEAVGEE